MSNALLAHHTVAFNAERPSAKAPKAEQSPDPAPPGYRWVSRRWRVLADGTRDYAAYHGLKEFRVLLPVSSKLHAQKH